ncbi:hypothetical protein [Citrobacter koseri]
MFAQFFITLECIGCMNIARTVITILLGHRRSGLDLFQDGHDLAVIKA